MEQEELLKELDEFLKKLELDLVIESKEKIEKSRDYEELLELKKHIVTMIDDVAKINDSNEEVMDKALAMINNLEVGSKFTLKNLFYNDGKHEYWERLYGKTKEIGLEFVKKVENKEIDNVTFVNELKEESHTSDHSIEYKKI